MKWAQLPEPGGLYGQNPTLLKRFRDLMNWEAEEDAKEQKRQEAIEKAKNKAP